MADADGMGSGRAGVAEEDNVRPESCHLGKQPRRVPAVEVIVDEKDDVAGVDERTSEEDQSQGELISQAEPVGDKSSPGSEQDDSLGHEQIPFGP